MPIGELMGARVEVGPHGFQMTNPAVDRLLPGGGRLLAERSRAILSVPAVGTFAVAGGDRIHVQPEREASPGAVAMWLHGTVAALLLAQRGRFALHASAVDVDERAVAVAGAQRVGKSTTALRLTQRGHTLVTDDVSPLGGKGPFVVEPYPRPVYVFTETAESLGLELSGARPLFAGHPKLALPPPSRSAVPLAAIVVLRIEANGPVGAARVRGAQAHWLVATNIYRIELVHALWRTQLFRLAASVSATVPVHVLTRPEDGWTVDEVADTVERIAGEARTAPAGASR